MSGFTPVPNWLIEAMPTMPPSVFQVCMVIARQTVGYSDGNGGRKEWDRISVSQFQKWTGLSRQGTQDAIVAGLGKWFVRRTVGKQWFEYKLVNLVDHATELTMQVSGTEPCNSVERFGDKPCNSVDPQKKGSKKGKKAASADVDADGRFTLELLHAANCFGFFRHDSKAKAAELELLFSMEAIRAGVNTTVERHLEKVKRGERGIADPVAYLTMILHEEAKPKRTEKAKTPHYIIDSVTGEKREVYA